jgi:MATE family multidrug resistance protein
VGRVLWQALFISFVGVLIFIAAFFASEAIFALAGHEHHIQAMEVEYFSILCLGGIFPLITASLSCFFSGRGRTRPIMVANIVVALVNIPMDYILIFGKFGFPAMGITGAAIATILAWSVGSVIIAIMVFRKEHEAKYKVWSSRGLDIPMLLRILRYGIAGGIEYFLEFAGYTLFIFMVGSLGATHLAVSNIIGSISSCGFLPCLGLHMATSALVGQAMGRKDPAAAARVTNSALHLALVYMSLMALLFLLIPGVFMDLFRPGSMSVEEFALIKAKGQMILYFLAIYYIADAFALIYYGCLKGSGDVWFVMLSMAFGATCLVLGAKYSLHFFPGSLSALWVVFSLYIILLAIISGARFKSGRWKKKRILAGMVP